VQGQSFLATDVRSVVTDWLTTRCVLELQKATLHLYGSDSFLSQTSSAGLRARHALTARDGGGSAIMALPPPSRHHGASTAVACGLRAATTQPEPHDVALAVSLPRCPRRSEPRYGTFSETLHTFAPPVRRESANMHAALVLRLHLGWMDDRECLVSSALRLVPAEGRYNVSRRCPQPSIGPLPALVSRCSQSRLLCDFAHHPLRGSSCVPHFLSSRRAPLRRPTRSPIRSSPKMTVCLAPRPATNGSLTV